jgi:hypothetical protein
MIKYMPQKLQEQGVGVGVGVDPNTYHTLSTMESKYVDLITTRPYSLGPNMLYDGWGRNMNIIIHSCAPVHHLQGYNLYASSFFMPYEGQRQTYTLQLSLLAPASKSKAT